MLSRINPAHTLLEMQRDLERMFEISEALTQVNGSQTNSTSRFNPVTQVWETNDAFILKMVIPGVDREYLNIEASQRDLYVEGAVHYDTPERAELRHAEFSGGDFHFRRHFRLTQAVKAEAVAAEYTDGILTLTLPKTDASRAFRVQLQGSPAVPQLSESNT